MQTVGSFSTSGEQYGVVLNFHKKDYEFALIKDSKLVSSYKRTGENEYCFGSTRAKNIYKYISTAYKGCTKKNCSPEMFELGMFNSYNVKRANMQSRIGKYREEICMADINGKEGEEDYTIKLRYSKDVIQIPQNIPYIQLSKPKFQEDKGDDAENVVVRKLDEIALEKDLTWLKNKKYYIVNDADTAEQIFSLLESYNGVVSYDTETTGLRINMFGKVGSKKKEEIEKYNEEQRRQKKKEIRVDRLVGIIFCIEPNVSYYFPCFNRKFKNLYEDKDNPTTQRVLNNIKSSYVIGEYRNRTDDMAGYVRGTETSKISLDVILMERVRKILERCWLLAHNCSFEWKVGWMYNIDSNLKEDSMLLHQLMYKFRSTTSNKGEPSNLKYLSKVELGVDQLELTDFFVNAAEDSESTVREKSGAKKKKKPKVIIDFSYMDYDGSKAYAPADGDLTLQIFTKYKRDMLENHIELEYLYNVEVVVACAIGYMEFYGHRLDEDKIEQTKNINIVKLMVEEHGIRDIAGYSSEAEIKLFNRLIEKQAEANRLIKEKADNSTINAVLDEAVRICDSMRYTIDNDTVHPFNLAAPAQVAELFFSPDKLGIPFSEEKISVNKKILKQYTKMKDKDGKPKYPIINKYTEWKRLSTLLTKFFDNLQYYMYPGGFIFSSYGQISTATGRMSCSKPNAQQYCKDITQIVIPREGYVHADADFSQIEYRTLVAMANEPGLKEKFFDPDSDYHTMMASLMFGVAYAAVTSKMRSDAKSFNFGIPYGMGFGSLAILLTGENTEYTREEAKKKYELYFKDQPNVRKFFINVKERAKIYRMTKTRWNRERWYSFEKDGVFSEEQQSKALRQAGNAVIQGTAADIFKISVARMFTYIRKNGLLGLLLIINMIHDEQLLEINVEELNVERVFADVIKNMEINVEGFPPLYVGGGISDCWKKAKGEMAEVHPDLANQFIKEAETIPIFRDKSEKAPTPAEVIAYFDKRVLEFRIDKIRKYVLDEANHNKILHPVIGKLLAMQFDSGVTAEMDEYIKEHPEMTKEEQEEYRAGAPIEMLKRFIEKYGIDVDYRLFSSQEAVVKEVEEEVEYTDGDEDEDAEGGGYGVDSGMFALIDEDITYYGVGMHDIIKQFGLIVSKEKKVCGMDVRCIPSRRKEDLVEYLDDHKCEPEEDDSMQVVFLKENNILMRTGVWVKGIEGSEMNTKLGINAMLYR